MRDGDELEARAKLVENVWLLSLMFNVEGKQDVRSGLVSCLSCTRGIWRGLNNARLDETPRAKWPKTLDSRERLQENIAEHLHGIEAEDSCYWNPRASS